MFFIMFKNQNEGSHEIAHSLYIKTLLKYGGKQTSIATRKRQSLRNA